MQTTQQLPSDAPQATATDQNAHTIPTHASMSATDAPLAQNFTLLSTPDTTLETGQQALVRQLTQGLLSPLQAERVLGALSALPLAEVFSTTSAASSAAILNALGTTSQTAALASLTQVPQAEANGVLTLQGALSYLMDPRLLARLGLNSIHTSLSNLATNFRELVASLSAQRTAGRELRRPGGHREIAIDTQEPLHLHLESSASQFRWLTALDFLKATTTSDAKVAIQEAIRQFVEELEREKREKQKDEKEEEERHEDLLGKAKVLIRAIDSINGKPSPSLQFILADLSGPFPGIEQAVRAARDIEKKEEQEDERIHQEKEEARLSFREKAQRAACQAALK